MYVDFIGQLQGGRLSEELLCRLFARTVLAASQPGALLITGDLTDGKTRIGRGQQLEEEWKVRRLMHDYCHPC